MALPSPPLAPQRGDRATFSGRVDAFLLWLVNLIPQLNTFLASLTTAAAGGANTFAYTFDAATADADPGTGKLRLGSATQNEAVVLRLDATAGNGGAIGTFLSTLAAGTSNVKGSVRLQRLNDVGAWLLFDVTAAVETGGYWNLTLTPITGSSPSPFTNNDTLIVFFSRHGNKGDSGGTPTSQQIRDAVGTMPIANGGTGATTASVARANIGAMASNQVIPILQGGTGASTASASLAALGGLPKTGGLVTGALTWPNNSGAINFTDTNGTIRGHAYMDNDDYVKIAVSGGRSIRWTNQIGNAIVAELNNDGFFTATDISQTSDERKKEGWAPLTDAQLSALANMELVGTFAWRNGTGRSVGGSAQEIQRIVPEAVHEDADGFLSVNYGGLAFAIQQAMLKRMWGQS